MYDNAHGDRPRSERSPVGVVGVHDRDDVAKPEALQAALCDRLLVEELNVVVPREGVRVTDAASHHSGRYAMGDGDGQPPVTFLEPHRLQQVRRHVHGRHLGEVRQPQPQTHSPDLDLVADHKCLQCFLREVRQHVLNAAVLPRDDTLRSFCITADDRREVAHAGQQVQGIVGVVLFGPNGNAGLDVVGRPVQRAVADATVVGYAPHAGQRARHAVRADSPVAVPPGQRRRHLPQHGLLNQPIVVRRNATHCQPLSSGCLALP